jgi:hypothetical protein
MQGEESVALAGVLTGCVSKPTFGTAMGAGMSGSYPRYS